MREKTTIRPEPGDILLGHLWTDRHTVMWNSLGDPRFSKKYLIQPYNNDVLQLGWVKDGLELCDGFFAVGGDYWLNTFNESPLKDFEKKIHHLNMAVDALSYPLVKSEFNPPKKRRFLYIGRQSRFGDEKGIGLLEELATRIPNFEGGYICTGAEIKGWKKISMPTTLTPVVMKKVAAEYDVFINMSRADAQATTILEAMCWGFPIACTNQSGYSRETSFFYFSLDDMKHNVNIIQEIQNISNEKLREISAENRRVVETKYSWDTFISNFDRIIVRDAS
ncbi:MAG: glycosyltransferase [Pseudomonadota bacterium]